MYESLITPPNSGAKTAGPAPSGETSIDAALAAEGVTGRAADFIKSVYQQESGAGANTKTSNAGAVGGMQIIPATFKSVADSGWDINNPEHNLRAGIRYAKQGFDEAGGDPVLAGAYYYGGPGGMAKARQGVAVSDPRNPRAPNTLQYGQQVASRMGDKPTDDQFYTPERGRYASLITPPPERGFGRAAADVGLSLGQGAVGAFKSLTDVAGANNPVSETLEGAANFLQDQKSEQSRAISAASQRRVKDAEESGDTGAEVEAYIGMFFDQPLEFLAQGVGSFATMGVGKALQLVKLGRAAKAAGVTRAEFLKTDAGKEVLKAAQEAAFRTNIGVGAAQGVGAAKGAQYEQTFNSAKAKGMSDEEADLLASEAQAYGGAGTGQQVLGGVLGAGAAATGPIEKLIAGKAAGGATSLAGGGAKGFGVEFATEGGQGAQQKYAGNDAAISAGVMDESQRYQGVAGQGVLEGSIGGVLGGAAGVAGAAFEPPPAAPVIPPALQPVAAKAAEPNSPLSKAAYAGAMAQAAAQPVVDPFATTSGAQPAARPAQATDEMSVRAREVDAELRSTSIMDALRADGIDSSAVVADLATMRDANAAPRARQDAAERVEWVMGWARDNVASAAPMDSLEATPGFEPEQQPPLRPTMGPGAPVDASALKAGLADPELASKISDVDRQTIINAIGSSSASGLPQQARQNMVDEALGLIGRYQAPSSQRTNEAPALTSTEAAPPATIDAAQEQQTVAQETLPEWQPDVAAPRVTIPKGDGLAATRKRAAVAKQLAANGFETVQRDGKDFYMVNTKTKQRFKLDGPADAQLARKAILDRRDEIAGLSPNSPKNDLPQSTPAQNAAGNYSQPEDVINGRRIRYENDKGSIRSGVDKDGKAWSVTMGTKYGRLVGVKGADKDGLDVLVGSRPDSDKIFVIDQVNEDGSFDEHKVVFGETSAENASRAYLSNYEPGWEGLGAIKEMTLEEFDAWTKPGVVTEPVALDKDNKATASSPETAYSVDDEGGKKTLEARTIDDLPSSPRSAEKGGVITKRQAKMLQAIGASLGREVKFYFDPEGKVAADGYITPGNERIININVQSGINPLQVLGHEFLHTLRISNPKAYAAVAAIVSARVKNAKGFREEYSGKFVVRDQYGIVAKTFRTKQEAEAFIPTSKLPGLKIGEQSDKALEDDSRGELEELVADLNGILMADPKFWGEVFAKVEADNGKAEAKTIIAQIAAAFQKMLDAAIKSFKSAGFQSEQYVNDMEAIRAAFRDAMADYVKTAGLTKMGMAAEVKKAEQSIRKSTDRAGRESVLRERLYQALEDFGGSMSGRMGAFVWPKDLLDVIKDEDLRLAADNLMPNKDRKIQIKDLLQRLVDGVAYPEAQQFANNGSYIKSFHPDGGWILSTYGFEDYDGSGAYFIADSSENLSAKQVLDLALAETSSRILWRSSSAEVDRARQLRDADRSDFWGREMPAAARAAGLDLVESSFTVDPGGALKRKVASMPMAEITPKSAVEKYTDKPTSGPNVKSAWMIPARADRNIRKSTRRPTDGLTVTGYHFSQQPRTTLSTGMFGTGLKGSGRDEIMAAPDQRVRERLSFYVNKGTGIRPEAGVGSIAHKAELTNIYDADADADAKRLRTGNARAFESAVIDAGYSGYLNRMDGSQPGQVVLLGKQTVKPEVLGPRTSISDAPVVPAPAQRDMDLADQVATDRTLPGGELTLARWSEVLMAKPELHARLQAAGVFDGDGSFYKSDLAARIRKMDGQIKKSAQRARDEYAEVEAKYKGTDQWMKAPDGSKTLLTERQWVQVRTPSFIKWFGDWTQGNIWGRDDVSKAVGENGEPLVVYHGTDKGGFTVFLRPGNTGRGDLGIWTTPDYGMAESYVRKGRAKDVDLSEPSRVELESVGFEFRLDRTEPTGRKSWVVFGPDDMAAHSGRDRETAIARAKDFTDKLGALHTAREVTDDQAIEEYYFTHPEGYEEGPFDTEDEATAAAAATYAPEGGTQAGVYALFINIRNPNEDNFEGAMFTGERPEQYVVELDGERQYGPDGRGYFTREEAGDFAMSLLPDDATDEDAMELVQPADSHYQTTDGVVREALRNKNDGAIIREVVDDGGGVGYFMDPQDIFVAFDPTQLKSADYNNGEFSDSTGDLRKSRSRGGLKKDVADAVAGINKVAASLTKPEREKLRKDTGAKMVEIYKALPSSDEVAAVAYAGKAKRGWYRHSVEAIQHIFGDEGWRFAALLAATSPQTSVEVNLENTLNTWKNWVASGRPTGRAEIVAIMGRSVQGTKGEDSVLGAWINNSVRALGASEFSDVVLSGPKVDSFMRNLNGNYQEVTNDAWMANYALVDQILFSGSANKAGTEPGKGAGYLAMSAKTREAAKKLGWEPAEVQETVWSWAMSMLETMDRAGESRGAIQLLKDGALTDDVINATPDFRSLFRAPRYAKILRDAGYTDRLQSLTAPTKVKESQNPPFDAAKMDRLLTDAGLRLEFLQRQRRTNVQISWEARPGESTGILPGMHSAKLELQERYLADIFTAMEGSGFFEKTGFSLRNTIFGPSAWEGKVLAGAQTLSRPGVVADNKGGLRVDQETRKKLETVASVLGLVLNQEGVYWHYPVYRTGNTASENGVEINFGRSLTNAEMERLYKAVSRRAGHTDWAPANTPSGVRILNFTDAPNKEFHRKVKSALSSFVRTIDADGELKTFSADGDAITNEWRVNPNGQDYRQRLSQARRPDLLEWVDDSLQAAVDAINKRYSEQYGWGAYRRQDIRKSKSRSAFDAEAGGGVGEEASVAGFGDNGRSFTGFFSNISAGKTGKTNGRKHQAVIPTQGVRRFVAEYNKHRGNFDDHIAASIPGFREVQTIVGDAIVKTFDDGNMLDIGGSEGALAKAVSKLSGGGIRATVLDPNFAMADHFLGGEAVEGVEYVTDAFGQKEDEGQEAWTEDDSLIDRNGNAAPNPYAGRVVNFYKPDRKFDVVHEAMVFQFISGDREGQVSRAKELMNPSGVLILEEKFVAGDGLTPQQFRANEVKKDAYKEQFFTKEEIAAKAKAVGVAERAEFDAQQAAKEQKVTGMNDLMASPGALEAVLGKNFKHVAQFWDSGNFKGYAASDSRATLDRLLGNMLPTESDFSTVSTPREVAGSDTYNQRIAALEDLIACLKK